MMENDVWGQIWVDVVFHLFCLGFITRFFLVDVN